MIGRKFKQLMWVVVIFSLLFVGCNKLGEPSGPAGPAGTGINSPYFTGVGTLQLTVEPTVGVAPLSATVKAAVTTAAGLPLKGKPVVFTTTSGKFPNGSNTITVNTDSEGIAETLLNNVTVDGTRVTASWSHYTREVVIDINQLPVAVLVVTPNAMSAGTRVTFTMDGSGSSDLEDQNRLEYVFNAGCSNSAVTVGAITPGDTNTPVQFVAVGGQTPAECPVAGDVIVFSLQVTDSNGGISTAVVSITVS
jgi:hypothetical protein